ncbi:MAG TPA: efflux RND transporter periplasmic adaptor subunit, partial [Pseudomonadales bacterium]
MKQVLLQRRLLSLLAVVVPLVLLLLYVAVRSGPLAPVAVTLDRVAVRALEPALFGIGTVEARYHYRIGPTLPGRVKTLLVDVGDQVSAGQLLGEMAPVDMDQRVSALEAQRKRAQAMVQEAAARHAHAQAQVRRYEKLFAEHSVSEEVVTTRQQELRGAEAALKAAQEEQARSVFELQALQKQRENLLLVAPADGVITRRDVDPGTTLLAGQAAIEMVDPDSLW